MKKEYMGILFVGLAVIFGVLISNLYIVQAEVGGANATETGTESFTVDSPGNVTAFAGNVSSVNINGRSSTQAWQGYYGNVTGTLVLTDSSNNILYDWNVADPRGEIMFSKNDSITWSNIQCFNYTAAGTFADDTSNAGATSNFGMNLSQIHDEFNILSNHVDSVDRTFNTTGGLGHPLFYVSSLQFSAGECQSTRLYVNSQYQASAFDNVLLYEPSTSSVVFTSVVEYQGSTGFNGDVQDFQALVLEDGHGTNTAVTTYYVFVELE
ncbi:hypothetical protein COU60_02780 [Candidatus Pacearchaeota archaeon CG10_big_fil_rev_8_21_14_0_10_34_76]|nr:MAG: hypothetical protein COU60_02780 [Candidatus Pacearchaeota archaeon CG10_big_fil_rev_8_21_14_0_10_34_76]